MKVTSASIILVLFSSIADSYIVDPGPAVIATKGEVWPKPQDQTQYQTYFVLVPQIFEFKLQSNNTCAILKDAFIRYQNIINTHYSIVTDNLRTVHHVHHKKQWLTDDNFLRYLYSLNVTLTGPCDDGTYPYLHMEEGYDLTLLEKRAYLNAGSIWGILRGLETFSQLIYLGNEGISLRLNATVISDHPRFSHRGLMLDTSRHYIPLNKILANLDAMAYNKLNVFHWHIVDDQSFPYVSKRFPELSEKGAYKPSEIYTVSDVQDVIEYARLRGIRVIPEFDTPGHTRSWGVSHIELLTECFGDYAGKFGPLDPTKNSTYEFLDELFQEIGEVFPDRYIHLGGDEVGWECWKSNPTIGKFMKALNITDDYPALENYYIQKLVNIVKGLSRIIVWEEVFLNGIALPDDTLIHVWTADWTDTLFKVTNASKQALLSACWYLDYLQTGGDWQNFYKCEPYNFGGSSKQEKFILGGEACMWAESVNEYNLLSRVWPRASATAERLWSDKKVNDTDEAARRLSEHTCRMNRRGIEAQPPNGPGYCP